MKFHVNFEITADAIKAIFYGLALLGAGLYISL